MPAVNENGEVLENLEKDAAVENKESSEKSQETEPETKESKVI